MRKKVTKMLLALAGMSLLFACNQQETPSASEGGSAIPSSQVPSSNNGQGSGQSSVEETPNFDVEESITLKVGESKKVSITNIVGIDSFIYTSYDPLIATVGEDGTVTGVKEGETSILVKGGSIRKTVAIEVYDPNKLEGLIPFAKLKNIAALDSDATSLEYSGAPILNYGWDILPGMSHGESTAAKFDFEGVKEDSELVGRGAAVKNANVYSGDYVVIMRGKAGEAIGDVTATTYHKVDVSKWANSFRLWGWSTANDAEECPLSGAGQFRVVAYEAKTEDFDSFDAYPLQVLDSGTLIQDSEGWISYSEVSNPADGQISGAPEFNMFVYSVNVEGKYDLRGKEDLILTVQFKADGKVADKYDAFGIKRMGFICDDKPNIVLASSSEVELFAKGTSQISVTALGDALNGVTSYESSDPDVATVSDTGLITAKDVAEEKSCAIKVTNDRAPGVELSVAVTVKPTPATSFTVPASITIAKGGNSTIEITDQISCEAGFTFESSFAGIASVDEDGVVTAVDAGTTQVKVTCGDLYKFVTINVTTASLYGLSSAQASGMPTIAAENTNVPAAWDFTWSGKTVNDNVVLSGDDYTSNLIHLYQAPSTNTVFENNTDCLGLISGIGGTRTEAAQMAMFTKVSVPSNEAPFRLWAKTPSANADMLDQAKIRVVVYIPNDDFTSFTAYTLSYDGYCDYGAAEISKDAQDIVTYKILEDGHFFTFSTPEAVRGKVGFLGIEAYSIQNEGNAQTRAYVRRFGWCW